MAFVENVSEIKASTTSKRSLEDITTNIQENTSVAELLKAPATKKPKKAPISDEAKLEKAANGVIRKIQGQINSRLKWKSSFKMMKQNPDITQGARVEVPCNDPAIFEKIFQGATIKQGKDGKLSCTFKENDQVNALPVHGTSYRYSSAKLRAPCSATYKDHALIFSFKFCIW